MLSRADRIGAFFEVRRAVEVTPDGSVRFEIAEAPWESFWGWCFLGNVGLVFYARDVHRQAARGQCMAPLSHELALQHLSRRPTPRPLCALLDDVDAEIYERAVKQAALLVIGATASYGDAMLSAMPPNVVGSSSAQPRVGHEGPGSLSAKTSKGGPGHLDVEGAPQRLA